MNHESNLNGVECRGGRAGRGRARRWSRRRRGTPARVALSPHTVSYMLRTKERIAMTTELVVQIVYQFIYFINLIFIVCLIQDLMLRILQNNINIC